MNMNIYPAGSVCMYVCVRVGVWGKYRLESFFHKKVSFCLVNIGVKVFNFIHY